MSCPVSLPVVIFLQGGDDKRPAPGYGKCQELLEDNFNVQVIHSPINSLDQAVFLKRVSLIVVTHVSLSSGEFAALHLLRQQGISIFVLFNDSEDEALLENFNEFLAKSRTGIAVTREKVLHETWYRNFRQQHPVISDGLVAGSPLYFPEETVKFVYPSGCVLQLDVSEKAVTLLTTAQSCHPFNRVVAAVSLAEPSAGGKTVCFGSSSAFSDDFIDLADNTDLLLVFMKICLTPTEILRNKHQKMPSVADLPVLPKRPVIPRRPLCPVPTIENVFRITSLEEHFDRMIHEQGDCDIMSQIRLEVEIERVAKELNVTWEINQPLIITPLEGYLPDIEFPIIGPECRIPGEPRLQRFDLDEDLVTWNEQLERLTHEVSRGIGPEDFFVKTAESMGLSRDLDGRRMSATVILQAIGQQILKHEQKNQKRDVSSASDSYEGRSIVNGISPDATKLVRPSFSLLQAANFLTSPKIAPITDSEILQDCLDRRRSVLEAKSALSGMPDTLTKRVGGWKNSAGERSTVGSRVNSKDCSPSNGTSRTTASRLSNVDVWRPPHGSPISFRSVDARLNLSYSGGGSSMRHTLTSGRQTERILKLNLYDPS